MRQNMRKVLTALFIIFESISAIAAEIDSVWLSATYHVVLKRRVEKGVEESQATLDIGSGNIISTCISS